MRVVNAQRYRAERAWGADDLALIDGASVRLHWTDAPYGWHANVGREVFAVVDGVVRMHYRDGANERVAELRAGDIVVVEEGDEHFAEPVGEARILVIEQQGSI